MDRTVPSKYPLSMEDAGGTFEYILYRHFLSDSEEDQLLDKERPALISNMGNICDFGYFMADGRLNATVDWSKDDNGKVVQQAHAKLLKNDKKNTVELLQYYTVWFSSTMQFKR